MTDRGRAGGEMTAGTAVAGHGPPRDAAAVRPNLLDIENLAVRFELPTETVRAVSGVSLTVAPSETFALVGESGSGKACQCCPSWVSFLHRPRWYRGPSGWRAGKSWACPDAD